VIAGAEKSTAGCARRSPGDVPKDAGSTPATSTSWLTLLVGLRPTAAWAAALTRGPSPRTPKIPDGGYFVTVPALPGCFTRGSTIEECTERAVEAIETHIAGLRANGELVPEEAGEARLLAVTVAA